MRRAVLAFAALAAARPAAADTVDASPADAPPQVSSPEVDLLIVVDTSAAAAPLRAALPTETARFVDELAEAASSPVPLLDLHVGVITADPADGGALHAAAADCAAAPGASYLAYAADASHAPIASFPGSLSGAIACLLPPAGASGADVAQPFSTILSALGGGVAANAGFRRPGAMLAVLVITMQDDCSSTTGTPLDRWACAQAGWECTPPLDEHEVARSCEALDDPVGLISPVQLATALVATAPPGKLVLGALRGDAEVTVTHGGTPDLATSCTSAAISAWPSLRLDGAFQATETSPWLGSACASPALAGFADRIVPPPQPVYDDGGFYEDCDGGGAGEVGDPGGCGCRGSSPSTGGLLLVGLSLLGVTRRSSPSRRCRARRARAAG